MSALQGTDPTALSESRTMSVAIFGRSGPKEPSSRHCVHSCTSWLSWFVTARRARGNRPAFALTVGNGCLGNITLPVLRRWDIVSMLYSLGTMAFFVDCILQTPVENLSDVDSASKSCGLFGRRAWWRFNSSVMCGSVFLHLTWSSKGSTAVHDWNGESGMGL